MELGEARHLAKGLLPHLRGKAGPSHTKQQSIFETAGLDVVDHLREMFAMFTLAIHNVQPAQPLWFVLPRPDGFVTDPQATNLAVDPPIFEVLLHRVSAFAHRRALAR